MNPAKLLRNFLSSQYHPKDPAKRFIPQRNSLIILSQQYTMNERALLPPKQKQVIKRKPDLNRSLSRQDRSAKKHSQVPQHNSNVPSQLECSFISIKSDSVPRTPQKCEQPFSNRVILCLKTRNNNAIQPISGAIDTGLLDCEFTPINTKRSSNDQHTSDVQNSMEETITEIKAPNQLLRLRTQNQTLSVQNRRLRAQVQVLRKQKQQSPFHARNLDLLARLRKENQQLKYQCHYLNTTVSCLEEKLAATNDRVVQLKILSDSSLDQLQYQRERGCLAEGLNALLQQNNSSLKAQLSHLSQQVRYLSISLSMKEKRCEQLGKAEKGANEVESLKRLNKILKSKIIQLKQKSLMDDLYELTPQKSGT